jgi:hypothetical protein
MSCWLRERLVNFNALATTDQREITRRAMRILQTPQVMMAAQEKPALRWNAMLYNDLYNDPRSGLKRPCLLKRMGDAGGLSVAAQITG